MPRSDRTARRNAARNAARINNKLSPIELARKTVNEAFIAYKNERNDTNLNAALKALSQLQPMAFDAGLRDESNWALYQIIHTLPIALTVAETGEDITEDIRIKTKKGADAHEVSRAAAGLPRCEFLD